MNVYYQTSRDTFPRDCSRRSKSSSRLTHFHLADARPRCHDRSTPASRLSAAAGNAPGTIGQAATVSPGAHVKNVNVFDPDGIRLELNEYIPDSLPKKAVDSWQ
jgi:hypothetical protein